MEGKLMDTGERSATFLVRVSKKPNEPWQGNVVWVSERCEHTFSNMQELFQLMDNTLSEEDNETRPERPDGNTANGGTQQ